VQTEEGETMADRDRTGAITISEPKVTIERTDLHSGEWRVHGTVEFQVARGGHAAYGSLTLPFQAASNEADALMQVRPLVEQILVEFQKLLDTGRLKK
jgi:hypothetical protein